MVLSGTDAYTSLQSSRVQDPSLRSSLINCAPPSFALSAPQIFIHCHHIGCSYETQDGLYDVAWSEVHENQLVTASGDGSIKLWDIMLNVSLVVLLDVAEIERRVEGV